MPNPKLGELKDSKPMHYSVGALIKKDNKYLLIDRVKPPLGFAGLAGHIDEGEKPEEALKREVKEESGLEVIKYKLLFEEELDFDTCSKEIERHYWHLFECEIRGDINRSLHETKSIGWFSANEIKNIKLEPAWDYWFKKLKIT
jgi:8-oxo-dGTP pyrophosphatase MutT (NUDIX family)